MDPPALKTARRPGRLPCSIPPARRTPNKRVRIIKKVRLVDGVWKFVFPDRPGSRYVSDSRLRY